VTEVDIGADRRCYPAQGLLYDGRSTRRKRRRHPVRREHAAAPPAAARAGDFYATANVRRLAYSRRQAAEALGVSISTIDRRIVPAVDTVKTPWGQRLIPVDELERFLAAHVEPGAPAAKRKPAGRPVALPESVVERIRLDVARGRSFGEIARALTSEGVATAHGGQRWWASTVRSVVLRASR
jgi:hypothetical protein